MRFDKKKNKMKNKKRLEQNTNLSNVKQIICLSLSISSEYRNVPENGRKKVLGRRRCNFRWLHSRENTIICLFFSLLPEYESALMAEAVPFNELFIMCGAL